jgi:hypothetical protein
MPLLYKRENEDIKAYKKVYKKEIKYNKPNHKVTLSVLGSSLLALFR